MNSDKQEEKLRITEIFLSLQGESSTVGVPTVFVRLTGCPLRCVYCDTSYAFQGGEWNGLDDILKQVESYGVSHVTVTGGEPLAQKACLKLLQQLSDKGFHVSLETSGAIDMSAVDERVYRIMDIKTPGSGECDRNLLENIDCLRSNDEVKFVICNQQDYEWSKKLLLEYELDSRCSVLFSPSTGELDPTQLADWIVTDRLPVRFQLQLHKILWGDQPGR